MSSRALESVKARTVRRPRNHLAPRCLVDDLCFADLAQEVEDPVLTVPVAVRLRNAHSQREGLDPPSKERAHVAERDLLSPTRGPSYSLRNGTPIDVPPPELRVVRSVLGDNMKMLPTTCIDAPR